MSDASKPEKMSEPPGPTAFTIDFGEPSKKLGLKEGLRHFAPSKKGKPKSIGVPRTGDVLENHSKFVGTNEEQADAPNLVIDKENNLTPLKPMDPLCDSNVEGSDTGTYTIDNEESSVETERLKIDSVFCVEKKQLDSSEWVSQWASSSSASAQPSPGASPTTDRDTEGSRARRKLPATPAETEDFLQDTISVMAAMEARIGEEKGTKTTKVSAIEERKMAWERRKNYDPLKAVGKKPSLVKSSEVTPVRASSAGRYAEESDSCSEVEQHQQCVPSHQTTPKSLPSTRPNRAFALRKNLNSATVTSQNGKRGLGHRTDSGRLSLRNMSTSQMTSSTVAKKHLMRKPISDTRSSSSLSSKEAEFQAWKRRKNYNPLRSAETSKTANNASSPLSRSTTAQKTTSRLTSSKARQGDISQLTPMQRSASFHYPDGLSRVQHNVYSSEDESTTEDLTACSMPWHHTDLVEVNDDELILPIRSSGHPRPTKSSPKRMEALDNLVISTIFSISAKLCYSSGALIKRAQDQATNQEQLDMMDTLVCLTHIICILLIACQVRETASEKFLG